MANTEKPAAATRPSAFICATLIFLGPLGGVARFQGLGRDESESAFNPLQQACLLRQVLPESPPPVPKLAPSSPARVRILGDDRVGRVQVRAAEVLGGAVGIVTESYDDLQPVGVDPRWAVFANFRAYLVRVFPLVHARLTLRKINTYGLWFEWTGTNAALKPVLFMAHQDVVPVDPSTVGDWTHPPYSRYFDGQRIWGRGSADDKNGLVAILYVLRVCASPPSFLCPRLPPSDRNRNAPLAQIHPRAHRRRGIRVRRGSKRARGRGDAGTLAAALLTAYGEDAFAFILDKGGIRHREDFGTPVAYPCVAEKGYLDVVVEVTSPGGHSSVPPEHTTIGILAALIVEYEASPYPVHLVRSPAPLPLSDPPMPRAAHTQHPVSNARINALRTLILASAHSDTALRALEDVLAQDKLYRSQIGTTQAARAVVNHRILAESEQFRSGGTRAQCGALAERKFNLSFTAFGAPASGTLTLKDMYDALEPAPVTPTMGEDAAAVGEYQGCDGDKDNDTVVVAPAIMSGDTDTQFYWNLFSRIFRYGHGNAAAGRGREDGDVLNGIHTMDASIDADDFVDIILFHITLILNANESVVL
ncbi:hypothetical protein K438DRAFT_1962638 [Mycena galopus ATCC 62051]|nr:hypothetical protein K438DRAFT_1962638 [Mycena galopus ATCC 62051]